MPALAKRIRGKPACARRWGRFCHRRERSRGVGGHGALTGWLAGILWHEVPGELGWGCAALDGASVAARKG